MEGKCSLKDDSCPVTALRTDVFIYVSVWIFQYYLFLFVLLKMPCSVMTLLMNCLILFVQPVSLVVHRGTHSCFLI